MTTNPDWGAAYYDHYVKYLRNPCNRKAFSHGEDIPDIQVLEFDNVFEGCRVSATLGVSHYSEILGQRAEVVLSCDAGWEMAGYILANSLFHLIQSQMKLGPGVGLAGVEKISPEFVSQFGKSAIYFSNPVGFPEEFRIVSCDDENARVYLAVFISKNEFNYFLDRGATEFEALLERKRVDPFNIKRKSSI